MTIAVMQPYIFPYLGYYQLVHAVDKFIFFDDVNYINKGWINRNRILRQHEAMKFTVPLLKASQNKCINEIEIADYATWRKEFLRGIELNYKKAPFFEPINNWLVAFLITEFKLISDLAASSVTQLANLFNLTVEFDYSSKLNYKRQQESGREKILEICRLENADTYINPKNGKELYDPAEFKKSNIKLNFIEMKKISYNQLSLTGFVEGLSILDVLMFNGTEKTKDLLTQYSLV